MCLFDTTLDTGVTQLYILFLCATRHFLFSAVNTPDDLSSLEGVCEFMYVIYCCGSDPSLLAPMFLLILFPPSPHADTQTHWLVQIFGCDGTILLSSTRSSGINNALRPHRTSYRFNLLSILSILHKTMVKLSMER